MSAERYWEERWRDEAAENDKLRIKPHELKALHEMIIYARSMAQLFPDKSGDTFAARMHSHAKIVEDMLERVEEKK